MATTERRLAVGATHEVRNQVPPLEGRNLFEDNLPLVEALEREGGGWARDRASEVGARWGKGCEKCNNTGYKGRVGLYEVMEVTEELRELILVGASSLELRRKAVDEGMITLRSSGLRKVKDGVTTIEEIVRETVK